MKFLPLFNKIDFFYKICIASDSFAKLMEEVKNNKSAHYKGLRFVYMSEDLDGRPGSYAWSLTRLKSGNFIIEYDFNKNELKSKRSLYDNSVAIKNPSISDLDKLADLASELKAEDDISIGVNNISRELELDPITNSFRTLNTNLLSFVNSKFPGKLPEVGPMIGHGAEGEVYEFGKDKILKLFLMPDSKKNEVSSLLKRFQANPAPCVPRIYDYKLVGRVGQSLLVGGGVDFKNAFAISYYIADKVTPIVGERDKEKVEKLRACLKNHGFNPWDFDENPDNTMQDAHGNYVYVDMGATSDIT